MISWLDIQNYFKFRGQKIPQDSQHALNFAVTELGEVFDARERLDNSWLRNNPNKEFNLAHEYGDVYQMLQIASVLDTGQTLEENLQDKWESKGFVLKNKDLTNL